VRSERGAATVEWTGLVLVVTIALGATAAVGQRIDGRSYGAFLVHSIVCAIRGGCDDGDEALAAAYGSRDAALVREYAPGIVYEPGERALPVDFRECRSRYCSDAADDPRLDVHRSSRTGHAATAFTRVVRDGGETFIQYWLYYPDSTSTVLNAAGAWNTARGALGGVGIGAPEYPGYHRDDWESYQVRIDGRGRASVRASSHGGYQWCKEARCSNRWGGATGWTRVSRGSHAGHIPVRPRLTDARLTARPPFVETRYRYRPQYPGRDLRERTTTSPALRLVPIERVPPASYRQLDPDVAPPWRKEVYADPRSDSTG
jgi:hypothetical protein